MRLACIGIGSNAIRLLIAQWDAGRLCVQAGPIVYCAESVDNGENLHAFAISPDFGWKAVYDGRFGLNVLEIAAFRREDAEESALYARAESKKDCLKPAVLRLIPYSAFANRGESDMLVWLNEA